MKESIILVSDVHVKNRLWTNNSLVVGDAYEALKYVASKSNNSCSLISCGDFFDVFRPTSKDLTEAGNFFKNFKKVYYVDGNHDLVNPSLMSIWADKCVKLTSSPEHVGNLLLYGVDYCSTKEALFVELQKIKQSIEELRETEQPVVILHQALKEFLGFDGSYTCSCEELFDLLGSDIKIYCGDIHIPDVVESGKDGGFVCSPGPLVPQDIGQAAKTQYYYYVDPDTGNYLRHDIKVRPIDLCFNLEELTSVLSRGFSTDLLSKYVLKPLIYTILPTSVAVPKLPEDLQDKVILIVRRTSDRVVNNVQQTRQSSQLTLKNAILTDIRATQKKPDKLVALASVLLDAENADEVLLSLLQKMEVISDNS